MHGWKIQAKGSGKREPSQGQHSWGKMGCSAEEAVQLHALPWKGGKSKSGKLWGTTRGVKGMGRKLGTASE